MCNAGTSELRVKTEGGHVCNFDYSTIWTKNLYKLATRSTCTRKYEKKTSVTMNYAGYKDPWWEEKTSKYPWCFHNDATFWNSNWDWCIRQLH